MSLPSGNAFTSPSRSSPAPTTSTPSSGGTVVQTPQGGVSYAPAPSLGIYTGGNVFTGGPTAGTISSGGGSSGGGGGGGSSGGSSGGTVVQTPQGGVSYAAPTIQQQTAQQKLDAASKSYSGVADTYGKSNLYASSIGLSKTYSGLETRNAFQEGLLTGSAKPLTSSQKSFYASEVSGGATRTYLGNGQYSPTATGRGTIIQGQNIDYATKGDLAKSIDNKAKIDANIIITTEQNKVINELKPTYISSINSYTGILQEQVDSGKVSVEEANVKLKDYVDNTNKAFTQDINSKLNSNENLKDRLKAIDIQRANKAVQLGITPEELNRRVGKFEARTGLTPSAVRQSLEVGAVTVSSIVNPALGYTVGGLIGLGYLSQARKESEKATQVIDIKKDAYGNIIIVPVKEIQTAKYWENLVGAGAFLIPTAYGGIKTIGKEITELTAISRVSNKLVTLEDLNKGVIKVPNVDYLTGKQIESEVILRVGEKPIVKLDSILNKGLTYNDLVNSKQLALGELSINNNPIKIRDLSIPQKKGYFTTKILGIELPGGRSIILGSKTQEGKLTFLKAPDLLKQLKGMPTITEIKLATSLETQALYKNLIGAGGGSTKRAKELIPAFQSLIRKTYNTPSRFIDERLLYEQTQYLPKKGVDIYLNLAKENQGVLFGSKSRAYQLAQQYNIKGKTFKLTKVPRDVEVQFAQKTENDLKALTDKSIRQLKELGTVKEGVTTFELGTAREIKGTPFAIEAKINGKFEKVAELKGAGNILENEQVSNYVVGFTKEGMPIYSSKGIPTTTLAEELRGVSQGVLRVRNVPINKKGLITLEEQSTRTITNPRSPSVIDINKASPKKVTMLDIYPSPKRMKDIGSVSVSARTLEMSGANVGKEISKIESLFPKKLVREQVGEVLKNPQKDIIASFVGKSPKTNINFNGLKISPLNLNQERKSPSVKTYEISPKKSPSITSKSISYNSLLKPSPSKSPYKSPSNSYSPYVYKPSVKSGTSLSSYKSDIKSPSPYKSPSLSPYKYNSPSMKSPSIKSPYIDIPSIFVPSGRNSMSLGESTKFNPNRIFPRREPKYTASLGSAIFGISKKVKAKDLASVMARLNARTYTGLEQRPIIEVISNKPINRKLFKALNI